MIQVTRLIKSFSTQPILNEISFEVAKGQILFVLGQSGTGKSILLKCLIGLLKIDSGEVIIDQQRVGKLTNSELLDLRKKCGMVFQQPALFDSLSIEENISYGLIRHFKLSKKEQTDRIEKALVSVKLDHKILNLKPAQVSYGMQKRISMARTLVLQPEILLFDEPTTGLDPVSTTAINRLILDISKQYKTTSIVVSHDMKCAYQIADQILFLEKGRVIFDDKKEKISQSNHPLVKSFFSEVRL